MQSPEIENNLVTEIQIERSDTKRRQHTPAYIRIMQQIKRKGQKKEIEKKDLKIVKVIKKSAS